MDDRELRVFVEVARLGSFRQAAIALHIAQPSVSHQIQRIEIELGVQLVDRNTRPVTLTEPGRLFLQRATEILSQLDQGKAEIKDLTSSATGRVALGATQYLIYAELPETLESFRRDYSEALLQFRSGTSIEVRQMLVDGLLDFGLFLHTVGRLPTTIQTRVLRRERFVLITAHDHPLAGRPYVDWDELRDVDFISFPAESSLDQLLMDLGTPATFQLRSPFASTETGTVLSMVSRGLGVALVPETLALAEKTRVSHVFLNDDRLGGVLVLGWRSGAYRSRAAVEFARRAVETLSSSEFAHIARSVEELVPGSEAPTP